MLLGVATLTTFFFVLHFYLVKRSVWRQTNCLLETASRSSDFQQEQNHGARRFRLGHSGDREKLSE